MMLEKSLNSVRFHFERMENIVQVVALFDYKSLSVMEPIFFSISLSKCMQKNDK